jgi:GT2 family glycosyltransferase/glycosyltransferase involved in cell wall biosynthesis
MPRSTEPDLRQRLDRLQNHLNQLMPEEGAAPPPSRSPEEVARRLGLWLERGRWRTPHPVSAQLERFLKGDWQTLQEFDLPEPPPQIPSFDDDLYLLHNPDIAGAIRRGLRCGLDHWLHHGHQESRLGGPWLMPLAEPGCRDGIERRLFGLNLYSFLSAPSGLGAAGRGYRAASLAAGLPIQEMDVPPWDAPGPRPALPEPSYRVNFLHQNPDMLPLFARAYGASRFRSAYNIGFWVWEQASVPLLWFPAYHYVDEIWVPSRFNRDAFATRTNLPIQVVPHVVENLEKQASFGRDYFGFPKDAFVFGLILDVASYFERKNPLAAVRAFRREFGENPKVRLLIKISNAHYDPFAVRGLEDAISGAPNIQLLDQVVTRDEILSLHRAIDCLVSPHRAEGFGLNLAESMYFGKPVVATGYSGNLEFMDEENSYLIRYRLTAVSRKQGPYEAGACWAEPDPDQLASILRRVVEHPAEAEHKGRLAASAVHARLSSEAVGRLMRGRLASLGLDDPALSAEIRHRPAAPRPPSFPPLTPSVRVEEIISWYHRPLISVIVPTYNMDPEWLGRCIESVRAQHYPYWELCIRDDFTTRQDSLELLRRYKGIDPRIKIIRAPRNLGISGASNLAVEISSGDFLALLDSDDELTADALYHVAALYQQEPDMKFIYSDEDKVEVDGTYCEPYYKPDYSPELLRSMMYFLHLMVIRKDVFWEVGGFKDSVTWSQDHDLALRVATYVGHVHHIPRILYHWRKIPGSAAQKVAAKPVTLEATRQAIEDHVNDAGLDATVENGLLPGLFRVKYRISGDPPVSLCMLTIDKKTEVEGRGRINLVSHMLHSIVEKTEYKNYEIVIIDDGILSEETIELLKDIPYRRASYGGRDTRFNFSKKANHAIRSARHAQVVLLNDDMEVISGEWLSAMLEFTQQPAVGAVGARLLFPDDTIQHAGVVLGPLGSAAHAFHGWPWKTPGYNAFTHCIRNYSAVTAACIALRKEVFEQVGGFDETFPIDYNDIDFCLRILEQGYRIVYTPYAALYHFENKVLERKGQDPREVARFFKRWRKYMIRDPFYNPHTDRDYLDLRPKLFGQWPAADQILADL